MSKKKKKFDFKKNIKESWKHYNTLPLKTITTIRNTLVTFLIADLIGVYGYFKMRRLGIALFVAILIFMIPLAVIERRKLQKMTNNAQELLDENEDQEKDVKDTKETDKPKDKPEEASGLGLDIGFGQISDDLGKEMDEMSKVFKESLQGSHI